MMSVSASTLEVLCFVPAGQETEFHMLVSRLIPDFSGISSESILVIDLVLPTLPSNMESLTIGLVWDSGHSVDAPMHSSGLTECQHTHFADNPERYCPLSFVKITGPVKLHSTSATEITASIYNQSMAILCELPLSSLLWKVILHLISEDQRNLETMPLQVKSQSLGSLVVLDPYC
jgi:hypothetical protein